MPDTPKSPIHDHSPRLQPDPALTHRPPRSWSLTLKNQTCDALEKMQINPLTGKLHLKNSDGRYGYIGAVDLTSNQLIVKDASTGPDLKFESADELIAGGWVID